ncbi:hypothetical protein F53441_4147 [Fusarium austroafricanum]|uniref:Cullin N-terminal domain-containing protein n=1 Tax=Fusarium austroafricanum TaxID=2364996 RepID=A0A8H4NZ59_9HYPO|nr:hypothetical protein F53441_4147 [Fusarium austroafricanum]
MAEATWVVVGASRGIGLEFVKQLLEAGKQVIATVRDPNNAKQLSSMIEAQNNPKNCVIEQCDVANSESIDKFAARISALTKSGTKLGNVILNAGILKYPNRATELTYQDFALHLQTNAVGPIICAQKLINLEASSPPSKVIFISSDSGSAGNFLGNEDGYAAYAASKSALNQALRHMALELKRRGAKWSEICVLALHPGEVNTDMGSIEIPWDVGVMLEPDESVRGMLNVIGEKNSEDSGTFWCWDGRYLHSSIMTETIANTGTPKVPDVSDPEALQAFLMNGISSILKDPEAQMLPNAYMDLYTAVHSLVIRAIDKDYMLAAKSIYKDLTNLLADHLQPVAEKLEFQEDDVLLESYFAEWDQYSKAAHRVDRLMNFINRHYVKRFVDEGRRGVYPIRLLHHVQWRSQVWEKISARVVDSAQLALGKGDGNAGNINDIVERFEKLCVDSYAVSGDDERTRIQKSLEAPFVLEVEKVDREVEDTIAKMGSAEREEIYGEGE